MKGKGQTKQGSGSLFLQMQVDEFILETEQKSKMWLNGVKGESKNISMEGKVRRAEEAARDRDLGYLVCCNKESLTLFMSTEC